MTNKDAISLIKTIADASMNADRIGLFEPKPITTALYMAIDALDAEPVRHGHWTKDGYCSVCGGEQLGYVGDGCHDFLDTDYCPHCGAIMDEVGE